MSDIHLLARARKSFEQHTWADSYRLFETADREAPLEPEDLERLATAAYLMGREDESEAFWDRAHRTFLERGDREGAARCACWLAVGLQLRGAIAPASGWFARAQHILDEGQIECVVRGFLLIPSAIQRVVQGDPAAGDALSTAIVHSQTPTATGMIQRSTDIIELSGDLKGRFLYHPTSVFDFVKGTLVNTGHQVFSGTVLGSAPVLLHDDEFRFEVDLNTGGLESGEVHLSDRIAGPKIRCDLVAVGVGATTPEGNSIVDYSGTCTFKK